MNSRVFAGLQSFINRTKYEYNFIYALLRQIKIERRHRHASHDESARRKLALESLAVSPNFERRKTVLGQSFSPSANIFEKAI
jgi:hypothetical protein